MGDEDDLGAILSDADRADIANLGNDAENWQTENPGASAREVNEHLEGLREAVDAILEQYKEGGEDS